MLNPGPIESNHVPNRRLCQWQPHIGRHGLHHAIEAIGRNADHNNRNAVERGVPADDGGVAAEVRFLKILAQNRPPDC